MKKAMKLFLTRILVLIFFTLALLHFYWAFGGNWAFESALPTNNQGIKILNPQTIDSVLVGVFFFLFGTVYLFSSKIFKSKIINKIQKIGLWFIPIVFVIRAIGDFEYVGFFKQITTTEFAHLDTLLYSPLCLAIGFMGFFLLNKRSAMLKNKSN